MLQLESHIHWLRQDNTRLQEELKQAHSSAAEGAAAEAQAATAQGAAATVATGTGAAAAAGAADMAVRCCSNPNSTVSCMRCIQCASNVVWRFST